MTANKVPTSWYEGAHLLARLRAYDVPNSVPAWCVATGHLWGPYRPIRQPLPAMIDFHAVNQPEPIKACRYCARCNAAQDYATGVINAALAPTPP